MKDAIEKAAKLYQIKFAVKQRTLIDEAAPMPEERAFRAGAEFAQKLYAEAHKKELNAVAYEQARSKKLLESLKQIQDAIIKNAEDTVWFSPCETLYDFIYTAVKEYEASK